MILSLDAGKVARIVREFLDGVSANDSLRPALATFAEREGIPH
jgi:hypothetical protein